MTARDDHFHAQLTPDSQVLDDYVNRLFLRDTDDVSLDNDQAHDVALVWYKLGASTVLAELADHMPDGQLAPLLRRMIPKLVEQVERP